jgi:hypothetical protein
LACANGTSPPRGFAEENAGCTGARVETELR